MKKKKKEIPSKVKNTTITKVGPAKTKSIKVRATVQITKEPLTASEVMTFTPVGGANPKVFKGEAEQYRHVLRTDHPDTVGTFMDGQTVDIEISS
jgi:hypothetical protein